MSEFISINLRDHYSLLAVWELQPHGWELVTLTRPKQAILLCANHPDRLVFPPKDNPNHIWQKRRGSSLVFEANKPVKNWERILDLIETSPGQNIQAIAEQLSLSGTIIRRNLKQLETKDRIYSRNCPVNSRTRLYFPVPATRRSGKLAQRKKGNTSVHEWKSATQPVPVPHQLLAKQSETINKSGFFIAAEHVEVTNLQVPEV